MKLRLTLHGGTHFLTNPLDAYVGKSIEVYGEWSHGEIELMAQLLKPSDHVLELGSNIGAHTVFIARDLVPQGGVYAFEPRRLVFQQLCANLALNSLANVHAFQLAVGRQAQTMTEGALPENTVTNIGAYALGQVAGEGETLEIIRIDDRLNSLKKIALVKADIEGYEKDFLVGAQALLDRDRPVLYLENDRVDKSPELIEHLLGLGYACWWHVVPLYRPQNLAHTQVNMFGKTASFNMLCVPGEHKPQVTGLKRIEHIDEHPLKPPTNR